MASYILWYRRQQVPMFMRGTAILIWPLPNESQSFRKQKGNRWKAERAHNFRVFIYGADKENKQSNKQTNKLNRKLSEWLSNWLTKEQKLIDCLTNKKQSLCELIPQGWFRGWKLAFPQLVEKFSSFYKNRLFFFHGVSEGGWL